MTTLYITSLPNELVSRIFELDCERSGGHQNLMRYCQDSIFKKRSKYYISVDEKHRDRIKRYGNLYGQGTWNGIFKQLDELLPP